MRITSDNNYIKETIYLNRTSETGKTKASVYFGSYRDFGTIGGKANIYIDGDLKKTITNPEIVARGSANWGGTFWDIAKIDVLSKEVDEANKVGYIQVIY
jgi:hypothetical protein